MHEWVSIYIRIYYEASLLQKKKINHQPTLLIASILDTDSHVQI